MGLGARRPEKIRSGPYAVVSELLAKGVPGPLWVGTAHDGLRIGEPLLVRRVAEAGDVDLDALEALRSSAKWACDLEDVGLLTVVDVRHEAGELLILSAFEEAVPLREALRLAGIRRRPIPPAVAARVVIDLCETVGYLHDLRRGGDVVLAALRPELIWVGRDGRTRLLEATVQDVVARRIPWRNDPKRAAYDAPERFDGVFAHPSDLWSLGVLLWEMLRNRPLYVGADYTVVEKRIKTTKVRRADAFVPTGGEAIDVALAEVVERCLSAKASDRFEDILALSEALRDLDVAERMEVGAFFSALCEEDFARHRRKVDLAIPGYHLDRRDDGADDGSTPSSRRRRQVLPSSRPPRPSDAPPSSNPFARSPSSPPPASQPPSSSSPLVPVGPARTAPLPPRSPSFEVAITELPAMAPDVDENAIEILMPVNVGVAAAQPAPSDAHLEDPPERGVKRVEVELDAPPPAPASSGIGAALPEDWVDAPGAEPDGAPAEPHAEAKPDAAPRATDELRDDDSEGTPPTFSVAPPPKTGMPPAMMAAAAGVVLVVLGGAWWASSASEGGPASEPRPASSREQGPSAPDGPPSSAVAAAPSNGRPAGAATAQPAGSSSSAVESMDEPSQGGHDGVPVAEASASSTPKAKPPARPPRPYYRPRPRPKPKYTPGGI